jgi:hypothetical protein
MSLQFLESFALNVARFARSWAIHVHILLILNAERVFIGPMRTSFIDIDTATKSTAGSAVKIHIGRVLDAFAQLSPSFAVFIEIFAIFIRRQASVDINDLLYSHDRSGCYEKED